MFTSRLDQQIKNLLLPWQRRFQGLTGENDLGPLKRWSGLAVLIFGELLSCLYLTTTAAALARATWQESQETNVLQNKAKKITESYKVLEERSHLTEGLLESLSAANANAQFLEKANLLAGQNQLTLTGISFGSPEEARPKGLLSRRSELNLLGAYEDLLTFIESLNRERPSLIIKEIKLSLPKNGAPEKIKASLFVLSYYSQEK